MPSLKLLAGVVIVVLLSSFWVLNLSTANNPVFLVANNSGQQISITVTTPRKVNDLGSITSGGQRSFRTQDETTMTVKVRYNDGREIDTSPLYFTSGIKVIAIVDDEHVQLVREATQ